MPKPRLVRISDDLLLTDNAVPGSWSGWMGAGAQPFITPMSGGSGYPQNTASRTERCAITFRFANHFPDSTLDNYWLILEIISNQPNTPRDARFRFRDLDGFVKPVFLKYPGDGDPNNINQFDVGRLTYTQLEVPFEMVVPGYIP